jgi:hypothetical protein
LSSRSKSWFPALPTTAAPAQATAEVSGGLEPEGGGAVQSRISKGTTAMFEAIP